MSSFETMNRFANRKRNLIIEIACDPRMIKCLIHTISICILYLRNSQDKIFCQRVVERRKGGDIEFFFKLICGHSFLIKGMLACIHNIHDHSTRPDVDGFAVGVLEEDFGGHVEKSSTLGFHIIGEAGDNLGTETEVSDLYGGQVTSIDHKNVL